jgi:hypothetical protein
VVAPPKSEAEISRLLPNGRACFVGNSDDVDDVEARLCFWSHAIAHIPINAAVFNGELVQIRMRINFR